MTKIQGGGGSGGREGSGDPGPEVSPTTARRVRVVPPARCAWCSRALVQPAGRGRRRRFCRPGCRQAAYVARRSGRELTLADDDVVVSRESLEELSGALYCIVAAVEDVERDLDGEGAREDPTELCSALDWLLENARPLRGLWLEARKA